MIELSESHLKAWAEDRTVVLRGALDPDEARAVHTWVEELEAWPERAGQWMKYFEGDERQLCRVENFLPYHDGMRDLLQRPDLLAALGELFGEPAILFKEKVNYKLAGGGGFTAHQDAPAFVSFGQTWHLTVLIAVDPTTEENGCLEMVAGHARRVTLDQEEDGTLARTVESRLDFRPLPTEPGDIVIFDSYVPHRSGPNRSDGPRRAIYVTYNPVSQGDRRTDYFERKRRVFPPECEREPGRELDPESAQFNLGNPIR